MHVEALDEAARSIAEARLARVPFEGLSEEVRPRDEDEGYAVQDALHERLTRAGLGEVTGYKIGCTTTVMQRYLGIGNPCAGGVLGQTVHHARATVRSGAFLRAGVECEIAVRLAGDLMAAGKRYDQDSVAGAVGACMAAIELVDDRYRDYRALDVPTLIADDFFNAGCVLGPEVTSWRALDLAQLTGRMLINGEEVGRGSGGDILGHPLRALAWLANLCAARGQPLRAGEFVLLGSVVQTVWLKAGDRVEIEIERLGGASLILE